MSVIGINYKYHTPVPTLYTEHVNTLHIYIVSQKNDTDVAHYNFDAHQPILGIFGGDVADGVCYRMVMCYPTSPN